MKLVERRLSDRFEVNLDCQLFKGDELICTAKILDISMTGLRLKVASQQVMALLPNDDREHKIDTVPIDCAILLSSPFEGVKIKLGVVYVKRSSLADSILGCRFEDFYEQSARLLAEYLHNIKYTPVLGHLLTADSTELALTHPS